MYLREMCVQLLRRQLLKTAVHMQNAQKRNGVVLKCSHLHGQDLKSDANAHMYMYMTMYEVKYTICFRFCVCAFQVVFPILCHHDRLVCDVHLHRLQDSYQSQLTVVLLRVFVLTLYM